MTTYGIQSTGFIRKPMSVILAEIEADNIAVFGAGVIQTADSPLGQLNGLRAAAINRAWEEWENAYQSFDVDQAEGVRLDILAQMRLLERNTDQSDADLRREIKNEEVLRLSEIDFYNALNRLDGVTWFHIYFNEDGAVDANGMPQNSCAVAALGGVDAEIAAEIRRYVTAGITIYGNTSVNTEINGICRTSRILRPAEINAYLRVTVERTQEYNECPPPSEQAIFDVLQTGLTGAARFKNGESITFHSIFKRIKSLDQVNLINVEYRLDEADAWSNLPASCNFDEIFKVLSVTFASSGSEAVFEVTYDV